MEFQVIGKDAKKKQLKTLITFHSPEVYERAVAEPNTSALGEALFARHFGIEIEGDTVQAKQRLAALDGLIAPVSNDLEDGDLEDGPLTLEQAPATPAPLKLPDVPAVDTAPIVPAKPKVEDIIPDRPVEPSAPSVAFTPVVGPSLPTSPQTDAVTEGPVIGDDKPAPQVVEPNTYSVGARLCPNCGNDMGTDPFCLACV